MPISHYKYSYSEKEYQDHLKNEHTITTFSTYLKEIVYGGSDGIVTTFAVVAGFAGATGAEEISPSVPVLAVLLFGLANLFADGTSMALGNFLSLRADKDLYRSHEQKEKHEIYNNPRMEWNETVHILKNAGFSLSDAKKIADMYKNNKKAWLNFMMTYELELPNPEHESPLFTSIATFVSFVVFGFVPLMPYVVFSGVKAHFELSVLFTVLSLILLGIVRWKVTGISFIRSVAEIVLLGSTSAVIAYIVGSLFRLG